MYLCLVISIFSFIILVNINIAEIMSAKINQYSLNQNDDKENDNKRSKMKYIVALIFSLFTSAVICFM